MGIFGKPTDSKAPEAPAKPASTPASASAGSPPAPSPRSSSASACVIGAKTVVKGEITGDEDIIVEGVVEGQIRIEKDLKVAPGGKVRADVSAQSVIVSGEISGDCSAVQRVEIQSTGQLTGNIRAPRIVIAEGAVFKGNSDMSPRKDGKESK